ncbi:MAG: sulfate/molybdate ABC transporter ATP-binding protein [Magnetococcales bacterium]|nr:sulfate/molybdate ABC transporter ATP-binding protein [Magnetococcales bacterium]
MQLDIQNVSKRFGTFHALNRVSLTIRSGELVALLGPSGSGKTTLLRVIAGLEAPDDGQVLFADEDITTLPARNRQVGFVFQHYALFRHMTTAQNIAFGLKVRKPKVPQAEINHRVDLLLKLVQLESMAHRYPSQLSGGQRQRVALARALAIEPRLLLLDEPFGALDAQVRKELRRWLRRLHDDMNLTGVFVTHDQEEAMEIADRVVVMNHGEIEQTGTPTEIYDHPATPFVYQFLGNVNRMECRLAAGHVTIARTKIAVPNCEHHEDTAAIAFVRPHDLELTKENDADGSIPLTVRHILILGPLVRLELEGPDHLTLEAELTRTQLEALHPVSDGSLLKVRFRTIRLFFTQ